MGEGRDNIKRKRLWEKGEETVGIGRRENRRKKENVGEGRRVSGIRKKKELQKK